MRRLADIQKIATEQEGLVRRQQMKDLGVRQPALATMVERGFLRRLTPQVFLAGVAEPTWRQQAIAAVWQAGAGAVLSHSAAARWWELPGYEEAPITVTVGRRRAVPRSTIGTVVRSRRMADDEVVAEGQMRVVSVPRTLIDLSPRLDRTELTVLVQAAVRARRLQLPKDLDRFYMFGRHYQAHLARTLKEASGLAALESWLEERFLRLLRANDFPAPATQRRVRVGAHAYRLDFVWPDRRLITEVDGYATHSTRAQQTADAVRRNDLTATGLRLLVFTYDLVVFHPVDVVEQLRRAFWPRLAA